MLLVLCKSCTLVPLILNVSINLIWDVPIMGSINYVSISNTPSFLASLTASFLNLVAFSESNLSTCLA